MSLQSTPNPNVQQALLRVIRALTSLPAQIVYYGSALMAIVAMGGSDLTVGLGTLVTGVGINVLTNILERVARGDAVSDEEIRKVVETVVGSLNIESLVTSNEFYRVTAQVFRKFDLITYAIQKGESAIANILAEQFRIQETMQDGFSSIHLRMESLATSKQSEEILSAVRSIADQKPFPVLLVDNQIELDTDKLRKSIFFNEFDRVNFSLTFAKRLIDGDLSGGNADIRRHALAWVARVLSRTEFTDKAEFYLKQARDLHNVNGTDVEIEIAQAFIYSQKGDRISALKTLFSIDAPACKSAALMIVSYHDGLQGAIDWLKIIGIAGTDLDPDGKCFFLFLLLQLAYWKEAQTFLPHVTSGDLQEAPSLNYIVAITYLLSTVPDELRGIILHQLPIEALRFPLASDASAINSRRLAQRYFENAASIATKYNCPNAAILYEDYALWLELRDPESFSKGKQRLENKFRNSKIALRYVHLGLQFGLKLDLDAIEQEIEREIALNGAITQNAALARFALARTQKNPADVASYITRYHNELATYFNKQSLQFLEIEMLAQARLLEKANEALNILLKEGISKDDEARLRTIIAKAEGIDPISALKKQFETTGSLNDLSVLVDELEARSDWNSFCEFGLILFERTHWLNDAMRLVNALNHSGRADHLVDFVKANSDLLTQSKDLRMFYCWALYHEGALLDARSELAKLDDLCDDTNYRALQINLGIALGDWNFFLDFVANECLNKEKRSPSELIGSAQLALHLGSPLPAKELILEAVDKGKDDANILAAAYILASNAGWEDDEKVFMWLEKAAMLSNEDGPVQKKSPKDIVDLKPSWDKQVQETWHLLRIGEIPMFIAAHSLNKSLINMMLFPALKNLSENDPRRRSVIPAYSGKRSPAPLAIHGAVGIDVTALLTLGFLNLIDKVFDSFNTIYLPHSTLAWLFKEKQKVFFHQPSKIREAHQISDMLATGDLERVFPSTVPDMELSAQIGDELALLITEAEKERDKHVTQHIVIRSSPVHRLSSLLMNEESDLSSHSAVLGSCQSIIKKLRQMGEITSREERKANAYLQLREKPWPCQPVIMDGAVLYLDGLSVKYFLDLGILNKLRGAGFKPVISPGIMEEISNLFDYEKNSEKVNAVIEQIRAGINSAIESGKIKVGKQRRIDEPEKDSLFEQPTFEMIGLANNCNLIITDDRFLNQHAVIDNDGKQTPIYSTLDLIDGLVHSSLITNEERLEYRTLLRRAGYLFIPVSDEELTVHIKNFSIKENKIYETADLRAIRENLLRVRMDTWLQIPNEAFWIDTIFKTFIGVLKSLWVSNDDLLYVRVCSDWLINQIDFQGWAHCFGLEGGDFLINTGRRAAILVILRPPLDLPETVKDEYWNWVEDRILFPIREQYPNLYSSIVDWYRNEIAELVNRHITNE